MPYFAPPAKNEISATPSPTNAAANAGFGKLWDMITSLFGTTGKPAEAYAAMKWFEPRTLLNLKPTFSVNTNALTITLKDKDAVDLGVNNPGFVSQRHATLGDGGFNLRKLEANISLVVSVGSTLGHVANVLLPIYIYLIDNAGVQELAVTRTFQGEVGIVTTVAEGGAGAADSATTMYSATARASVPARLIAVAWLKQAVAGNWVNLPTRVHQAPFGIEIPEASKALAKKPEIANSAVDAANDFDFLPGSVVDNAGVTIMTLAALLTKPIDAPWAVGHNQGGMLTGAVANDTWYGAWLLQRSDTGVIDAGYDPSFTTPTLPANYDRAWLVGVVRRATATNRKFYQRGDWIFWENPVRVLSSGGATAWTSINIAAAVPTIAREYDVSGYARSFVTNAGAEGFHDLNIGLITGQRFALLSGHSGRGHVNDFGRASASASCRVPNLGTDLLWYHNALSNQYGAASHIDVLGFALNR